MKKFVTTLFLLLICFNTTDAFAKTDNDKVKIEELEQKFLVCSKENAKKEQNCEEYFSTKCYYHFMDLTKKAQQCYKQILQEVLVSYYDLGTKAAEEKIDNFTNFVYKEYFFIYTESKYCKENCGIVPYLYSEDAATYALRTYLGNTLDELKSRS